MATKSSLQQQWTSANSISRSTGASKHHFALPYKYFVWCFVQFCLFFWLNVCDKQLSHSRSSMFIVFGRWIILFFPSLCLNFSLSFILCVFMSLYFWFVCVWSFAAEACLLCILFFFTVPLNFTYLIFRHKNSTQSSPRICNSCTHTHNILPYYILHTNIEHIKFVVSQNHLHHSMLTMSPSLLLLPSSSSSTMTLLCHCLWKHVFCSLS